MKGFVQKMRHISVKVELSDSESEIFYALNFIKNMKCEEKQRDVVWEHSPQVVRSKGMSR